MYMKGIKRILAIALAMLLLALPALAEEVTSMAETHTLTIANPVVYVNGVEAMNMEGLGAEIELVNADDGVAMLLSVLGGDQTAAEGYALFDGRQLVLGAEGLSNAYSLPLEKMMDAEGMEAFGQLAELFSEDTLMALMSAIIAPFGTLVEQVAATQVDEGVQVIDHTAGQYEMQGYTFTMTADMLNEFAASMEQGIESIPIFAEILAEGVQTVADAYNDEKGALDELDEMDELEGEYTVTVWMGTDEDGMPLIREEITADLTADGENAVMTAWMDGYAENGDYMLVGAEDMTVDGEQYMTIDIDGKLLNCVEGLQTNDWSSFGVELTANYDFPDIEATQNVFITYYPQGYTEENADYSSLTISMDVNQNGETNSFLLDGYYAPADGVNYDYDELYGTCTFTAGGSSQGVELLVQTQHADGHEYYGAQVTLSDSASGSQSYYYSYEGDYTANALGSEDNSGQLHLGASTALGGVEISYELGADVTVTHAQADASALPTVEGEAVDIMTLDEKGMEQLNSEGQVILTQFMGVLMANVPSITSMIAASAY